MKRIAFLVVSLFCFAALYANGSRDNNQRAIVVTPSSIGEYELGVQLQNIQTELGPADSVLNEMYYTYYDLGLSFIVMDNTVIGIAKHLQSGPIFVDGIEVSDKMTLDTAKKHFNLQLAVGREDKEIYITPDYQFEYCLINDVFQLMEFEIGYARTPIIVPVTPSSMGIYDLGIPFENIQTELGPADSVLEDTYFIYDDLGISFIVENGTVVGITKFLFSGSVLVDGIELNQETTLDETKKIFDLKLIEDGEEKKIYKSSDYHFEFYKIDDVFYLLEFEIG